MFFIIKLAFRNILRHTRRSVITAVAIMLMIALFVIIKSFLDGSEKQVLSNITKQSGHIQLHQIGYADEARSMPLDIAITGPTTITGLIKTNPHIKAVTERIRFMTLISNGEKTVTAMGMAITPGSEAKISDLNTKIIEGKYDLTSDKAIIGYGLAQSLHIKEGSVLTLVTNTSYGSMNAVDIEVSGIVRTGIAQMDDSVVFVNTEYAQTFLAMPDKVTELTLNLDDPNKTDMVIAELKSQLPKNIEVQSWKEINKAWLGLFDIRTKFFGIIMLVVLLVGGTSIFNTIVMAVSERTREIGTLLALGLHKRDIVATFMIEAAGIGLFGSIAGVLLGAIVIGYFSEHGIALASSVKDIGIPISDTLYLVFNIESLIFAFFFGIFISIVSSIIPARSAAKSKPIDALRYV